MLYAEDIRFTPSTHTFLGMRLCRRGYRYSSDILLQVNAVEGGEYSRSFGNTFLRAMFDETVHDRKSVYFWGVEAGAHIDLASSWGDGGVKTDNHRAKSRVLAIYLRFITTGTSSGRQKRSLR